MVEHHQQLAILVASGRTMERIGVSLNQDQVMKLAKKDFEKYLKIYEASCLQLIHFFSSHVKDWLIFFLLAKEIF